MKLNEASQLLEQVLGIAIPARKRGLGTLQPLFDEIVSQPWFDQSPIARDSFASYISEKFIDAEIDDTQLRSLLIAFARTFYSKQ